MTRTSETTVSGRDLDKSITQAADNDLTRPHSSSKNTAEFAPATSSPAENGSEEDQNVAFRQGIRCYSLEYAFYMDDSHSFRILSNSTYKILIIPLFEHFI